MKPNRISGSLIRKNLSRHWLLLLILCIHFLGFVSVFISDLQYDLQKIASPFTEEVLLEKLGRSSLLFSYDVGIFELYLGTIAPILAFSYLRKKRETHFFITLPVSKNTLYFSSLISSLLFYALPWLVTVLISTPVIYSIGQGQRLIWGVYFQAMVLRLGLYLICCSIATFATVLCGRGIFAFLLTLLIHSLPPMVEEYIYLVLENNLLGISTDSSYFLSIFSPLFYLGERFFYYKKSPPWGVFGIYVAVSFGILYLAALLHRKRKEEHVGQTLVFPSLYLYTQYLFTMVVASIMTEILKDFDIPAADTPLILPVLLLMPVAFFLCRMLLLRTIKVFQGKAFLQCGAFVLSFVALIFVFQLDLLGFVKGIPDPEKVERLTVSMNGMDFTTEDPGDIAYFIEIHKLIVSSKEALSQTKADPDNNIILQWDLILEEEPTYFGTSYALEITYEKKGQDVHRSYSLKPYGSEVEANPIWSALKNYFQDKERNMKLILQTYENVDHINISQPLWEAPPDTLDGPRYALSTTQIQELFQAILADTERSGKPLILQNGNLYGVEICVSTKDGDRYRFYLDYYCHETARQLLDSILDTYKSPS